MDWASLACLAAWLLSQRLSAASVCTTVLINVDVDVLVFGSLATSDGKRGDPEHGT